MIVNSWWLSLFVVEMSGCFGGEDGLWGFLCGGLGGGGSKGCCFQGLCLIGETPMQASPAKYNLALPKPQPSGARWLWRDGLGGCCS